MTKWMPNPADLHRPVYLSLAGQISRAIADGTLQAGSPMPTHRALADRLGISVQTVSRAYAELIRQGLLVGEVGRGTFVRPLKAEPEPPFIPERIREIVDLSILKPVSEAMHRERMQAALAELAADLPASVALAFRPNIALARHRALAVDWLCHCRLETAAKNVIVTNGATSAMTMALMTVARPGGMVVTEEIGHHTLVPLCSYLGLRLAGLAIDREGVLPEAFERACREGEVNALFVHPNAASPTSALMGAARRAELVELARRHQVQIIENDAWGPLIESDLPPLAALAPERTLYLTSLTKCVMPGLRTGFLVVPDQLIPAAANRHLVTNWMATALLAEIAARWIENGTALSLVGWQRTALRQRQKIAADILRDLPYSAHPEGLQVWLPLPPGMREDQFVAQARLHGVAIAPGVSFATSPGPGWPAVRIAIGATSEAELRTGLGIVADLHRSRPEPTLLAI
ncbi:PLP-dependent aminotransferase family protein [Benzoatithermus flavus]